MSEPSLPNEPQRLTVKLEAWSRVHASLLVVGAVVTSWAGSTEALLALASLSFTALLWLGRRAFTDSGRFGPANAVTLLRLALVLALGALPLPLSALLGGVILVLDGVDGWLARKTGSASAFGAHFDMETDAFFVLVMTVVLWTSGRLGAWILCGGLLRPLYVLWLWALPAPNSEEPRSSFGRLAFLGFAAGLVGALASTSRIASALALGGTALVSLSFARSARYWCRARVQRRSGARA